jgi:hypothetical protein
MVMSHSRGNEIYFDGTVWRYKGNGEIHDGKRACLKCGKLPTAEGYDNCIGYIQGAQSACCGHGKTKAYVKYKAKSD